MFSVRVGLCSRNAVVRSCLNCTNNRHTYEGTKQFTSDERERLIVKSEKINEESTASPASRSMNFYSIFARQTSRLGNDEKFRRIQLESVRAYATDEASTKPNVFGDLGDRKFERYEMDADEKAEEEFVENEARVHRRYKLTPGGYAKLIKSHIQKGDLNAALEVLNLVKKNRDEATPYMYNLLLRAHAIVGDFKQSRSLYATMKKRGLKCNDATYTSMINACANYHHSETALDYLGSLREEFMEKNIVLNDTHYNAMIKAYGRHGNILEAFRMADEMRDKSLPTGEITLNSLLIAAIADKEAGLRHALIVWHQILRHKIRPTITTYNLLLRAIRDTKLGDLKVNDILISNDAQTQILLNEATSPDLLARTPSINTLVVSRMAAHSKELVEEKPEVTTSQSDIPSDNVPATVDSNKDEKKLAVAQKRLLNLPLARIHDRNRLILFGGVTGILDKMEQHGVVPDTKTVTMLMELVPKSVAAEQRIIKTAKHKRVPLDVDFYNMLMKKRTIRGDYDGAKEILDDIQRSGLCPDIITWGILAMGCQTSEEARTLIEGLQVTGHRLNAVIAGTFINIACKKIRFGYILEIMETMKRHHVTPNWELYATLDGFQKEMEMMIKSKKFSRTVNNPAFKTGFSKFNCRYSMWQKEMGRKSQNQENNDNKINKEKKYDRLSRP